MRTLEFNNLRPSMCVVYNTYAWNGWVVKKITCNNAVQYEHDTNNRHVTHTFSIFLFAFNQKYSRLKHYLSSQWSFVRGFF